MKGKLALIAAVAVMGLSFATPAFAYGPNAATAVSYTHLQPAAVEHRTAPPLERGGTKRERVRPSRRRVTCARGQADRLS